MSRSVESGAGMPEVSGQGAQELLAAGRDEQFSPQQMQAALADLEQRVMARIESEVERKFQSAKDKRWAQLERQYGALSQMQDVQDDADANEPEAGNAAVDSLAQQIAALVGRQLAPAAGETAQPAQPAANPAGVAQPSGAVPVPDLQAAYERRKAAIRPGDLNALMALKREFRAQGLDVF